jgi:hypothetical protein
LEAADAVEARRITDTLPLAQKGMMDVQIIELRPYRGFGPRDASVVRTAIRLR